MGFIGGLADGEAAGAALELFDEDRRKDGYVWNLTRVLALRPESFRAWRGLAGTIRGAMDLRRYELVTLAAAQALRASYCALAHGKILREKFFGAGEALALARGDYGGAGLDAVDVAVVQFARQVAIGADRITRQDVAALQRLGLTDREVLDVALAAAARAFFTKVLDALGVEPDSAYLAMEAPLREALTVGRPIAPAAEGG